MSTIKMINLFENIGVYLNTHISTCQLQRKTAIKLVRLNYNEYSTLENTLSISPNKKQFSVITAFMSILQALTHLFYTTIL